MNKFMNKFRIESNRCQKHNYNDKGCYFITICTKKMNPYFGKIIDGKMILSDLGHIANNEWIKTPALRPNMNIKLLAHIIMPDHCHLLFEFEAINKNSTDAMHGVSVSDSAMHGISLPDCAAGALPDSACGAILANALGIIADANRVAKHGDSTDAQSAKNKFAPQSNNLASIIRGYKSAVTVGARKLNLNFDWQPNYHDRIVNGLISKSRIIKYIEDNPINYKQKTKK